MEGSLIQAPEREPVRVYSSLDMPAPRSRLAFSRRLAPLGIGPIGGVVHAAAYGAFNGSFASLPWGGTLLQCVQSDLGLTYGGTPLATAGNTSTTVLTLSGSIGGVPVPIWVKATNSATVGSGATFSVYYDGTGTTAAMTGVTPTAGIGVALTGAGTGLTLAWSAGTGVTNNTWKATCAGWADQAPTPFNFAQATAAAQPVITTGLNGFPGLAGDGAASELISFLNLPSPGTTPFYFYVVGRMTGTNAGIAFILSAAGGSAGCLYLPTAGTTNVQQYNGSGVNLVGGAVVNTWYALQAGFTNGASDFVKVGSTQTTGSNSGNLDPVASHVLFSQSGANWAKFEALAQFVSSAPMPAALAAAVTTKYGGSVLV